MGGADTERVMQLTILDHAAIRRLYHPISVPFAFKPCGSIRMPFTYVSGFPVNLQSLFVAAST